MSSKSFICKFYCLYLQEKEFVKNSINFGECKRFQLAEITAGRLISNEYVHQLISDDKICASFKTLRGTPQYFHNMLLDVLEKNMSVLCLFYDILMIVA